MTVLFTVFGTELLKLKRTLALWVMILIPAAIELLQALIILQMGTDPSTNGWDFLISNAFGFWVVLVLPLFVTLETALLGGLEHGPKMWKHLFALPVPRWTVFMAKALVAALLAAGGLLALLAGIGLVGLTLQIPGLPAGIQWSLSATTWAHLGGMAGLVCALSLLMVAIHTYVSLRWASMSLSLGIGMVATVFSFVAVNVDMAARLFPWSLPYYALFAYAREGVDVTWPLALSLIGGLLALVFGAWDMTRQDVV